MGEIRGLTEGEVLSRRERGLGNDTGVRTGRSYRGIVRTNLFTPFNNILFGIGLALVALGRYYDAFISAGLGLVNTVISTYQEIRAKRQLDRISVLSALTVTVVREGREREVAPTELVVGDVVRVGPGDQISVDGTMVGDGTLEVDESLLTGESDSIFKRAGDKLSATARAFRVTRTPLQRKVDLVVRLQTLLVSVISVIILGASLLEGLSTVRLVQAAAVLSGQVPYGLFLITVVSYALGASAIARRGALVQQVNAVESLSNIDVICTDKTGTLTANRLVFEDVFPLGGATAEEVRATLGDFARSASATNKTGEAIAAGLPGKRRPAADEVPFSSARKWSALALEEPERRGVYALGAIEMLEPYLPPDALAPDAPHARRAREWSARGLRVLLFARNLGVTTLRDEDGEPRLPPLTPLAVVALADELRPGVREAIAAFEELGVGLKVISGDDPRTVAALAKQAGFGGDVKFVSGPELAAMGEGEFDRAAAEATVFGRIAPEQKDRLVDALMRRGERVAMMGDGVNDVPALKKASLGVAMQSGASAARNVADMVLLNDSLAVLSPAFHEGRRIIGGMYNALYLFLARVATMTMIIIAVAMVGLDFPFDPAQVALTTFTVGIPSFFLTLWARPRRLDDDLLPSLARFVFPAAVVGMLIGLGIYVYDYDLVLNAIKSTQVPAENVPDQFRDTYESYTGITFGNEGYESIVATVTAQGSLSIFVSWTAVLLILFLEPPGRFFLGWRKEVSPDKRPAVLAAVLFVVLWVVWSVDPIGYYFGILTKPWFVIAQILVAVAVWFFLVRAIWRANLLERLLGLDDAGGEVWPRDLHGKDKIG